MKDELPHGTDDMSFFPHEVHHCPIHGQEDDGDDSPSSVAEERDSDDDDSHDGPPDLAEGVETMAEKEEAPLPWHSTRLVNKHNAPLQKGEE